MSAVEIARELWGRLQEAAEFTGYAVSRATDWYFDLTEDDRWRDLGFEDFDEFTRSIDLSMLKGSRRARQPIELDMHERGATERSIAAAFGLNQSTVHRDLKPDDADASSEDSEEVPDQQSYPQDEDEMMHDASESETGSDAGEDLTTEPEPEEETSPEPEATDDEPEPRAQINEGDEWYTPQWLFDALGIRFSMDVCAPLDQTHSSVPAWNQFTIEDDGLSQPWEGTVWCNPPYSTPEPWARRMIHHADGLLLCHMPMNAGWCVDMWQECDAIRLFQAMEFVRPNGASQRPGYWLQLAAFGPVATEALARLQPFGEAASNKRRIASPMWRRAA